ncbi:hypothetical protein CTAYLR_008499 [Chrysophaeum taylorii]|uniref:Xaa-Pro dipeptidyl-peptidase C-terminal domain-containing protein n=1 Tax=Chrysophaeum taylorii TaxID=2483200 RepID=A0AAD7UCD0_9STRA|nr:hypothetical protein CTAYLR_008499 [Chrysophaeum taylorii]
MPVFRHPKFELVGRKVSGEVPDSEYESVVTALTTYVQEAMRELGLREVWIPEKNAAARCCVFASEKLDKAKKILVILQNRVGGVPGIWSRSLCVKQGLDIGSMLPAIERALGDGYAVVVPNPNTNTVNRVPILHSLSPEDHVLHIWDTIVPAEVPTYLLTLGNGASLAVDVVEREQVREMRTVAVAAVEPSQVAGSDIDEATRARLARIVLAFEGNAKHEYPARLSRAEARLGCRCFAVRSDNLGRTMASSLDSIFAYFKSEATAAADYAAGEAQRAALVDFQVDDGGPRTTFYDDDEDEEDEGGRVGIRPSCAPGSAAHKVTRETITSWDGTKLQARVMVGSRNTSINVFINSWAMPSVEYHVPMEEMDAICVEYETRGFWFSAGRVDFGGPSDVNDTATVIGWAVEQFGELPVSVVGVSYGAGLSLLAAAHDPRIRRVVAYSAWGDLEGELNWNDSPSRVWGTLLLGLGALTGRLDSEVFEIWEDVKHHRNLGKVEEWTRPRSPATYAAELAKNDPAVLMLSDLDDNLFHSHQALKLWGALNLSRKALIFGRGTHAESELPGLFGADWAASVEPWRAAKDWLEGTSEATVTFAVENSNATRHYESWPPPSHEETEFELVSATIERGSLPSGSLRTGVPVVSDFLKPLLPIPAADIDWADSRYSVVAESESAFDETVQACGVPYLENLVFQSGQDKVQLYAYLYELDSRRRLGRLLSHVPLSVWNATKGVNITIPKLELHTTCFQVPAGHSLALGINMKDSLYTPATTEPRASLTIVAGKIVVPLLISNNNSRYD